MNALKFICLWIVGCFVFGLLVSPLYPPTDTVDTYGPVFGPPAPTYSEYIDAQVARYPHFDSTREVAVLSELKVVGDKMSLTVDKYCFKDLEPTFTYPCVKNTVTGEWGTWVDNGKFFVMQHDDGVFYLDLQITGMVVFIAVPVDVTSLDPTLFEILRQSQFKQNPGSAL